MWHAMKIGVAILAVAGLVMSGMTIAHAADDPDPAEPERTSPQAVIAGALAPLVEDGTLTGAQAEAVADRLAPLAARARFQEETRRLVKQFGRVGGEIAEVLGLAPPELVARLEAGQTLAEVAAEEGWSAEQLVDRVTEHIAAHLAVQVTAGKLDQQRADEVVASIEQSLGDLVDVAHPFRSVLQERRNRAARAVGIAAAADVLGLSTDEVRAGLEAGNSLAAIAAQQGVTEEELVEAVLAPFIERIREAVERGGISEQRAAELAERAAARIAEAIERVPGG